MVTLEEETLFCANVLGSTITSLLAIFMLAPVWNGENSGQFAVVR